MKRPDKKNKIKQGFRNHPVVAILGPRQCGKTTLAKDYAKDFKRVHYFDCEDPIDISRLENAMLTLNELKGLIVIDEVQRVPDLFTVLRVLVDRNKQQKYLILGSASQELIRQSSETLAGRIKYIELTPFSYAETQELDMLWLRGGYPKSYLAKTLHDSSDWRQGYIKTFLEKDIPQLGIGVASATLRKFWAMLTAYHGNLFNASELGRSLGVAHTTVQHYLDILCGTFMVRQLKPWHENITSRQVKSPKIYFRDSGILHTLMRVASRQDLEEDPKLGASWEGFALEEIIRHYEISDDDCYFWATYGEAELDLLLFKGKKRLGFEFKYTDKVKVSKSMHKALEVLKLDELTVVVPGKVDFPLASGIRVKGLEQIFLP